MPGEVRQLREEELANRGVVDFLEKMLLRAKAGEINSIIAIAESRGKAYEYTRLGFSFPEALGMHSRAMHDLHKQWDEVK